MENKYLKYKGKNIDWEDAVAKYEEYSQIPYRPEGSKLPESHIEDEEKSVRWNREFVQKHNENYDKEVRALSRKRSAIIEEAQNMVKYLMCEDLEWKLTDRDIQRLFSKWYDKWHSDGFKYMCDCIQCELDEICNMDWWKTMKRGEPNYGV